jgi:hypothetical protein
MAEPGATAAVAVHLEAADVGAPRLGYIETT